MNKKIRAFVSSVVFLAVSASMLLGFCLSVLAQTKADNGLTLTIVPPLVKINMVPGQVWSSSLKVVNNNKDELTVYASALDFTSNKENGAVEFIPKENIQEGQSFLLSQWLEVSLDPIVIAPYQSKEIPFTIRVPEGAEPGGHYAAILVSNRAADGNMPGSGIKVASSVSCLILLNVQGEVVEDAIIREFSSPRDFYQKPAVDFVARVENKGNVHIQPKGEIKIFNFWGKERGSVVFNQSAHFGNVLPKSVRRWRLSWSSDEGLLEIGRFKAILILSFGEQAKQTASAVIYFWVVPLKPILGISGFFIFFVLLLVLILRVYIKRAILTAQRSAGLTVANSFRQQAKGAIFVPSVGAVIDLNNLSGRERAVESFQGLRDSHSGAGRKVKKVLFFLLAIAIVAALFLIIFLVFIKDRPGVFSFKKNQPVVSFRDGVSNDTARSPVSELNNKRQGLPDEENIASFSKKINLDMEGDIVSIALGDQQFFQEQDFLAATTTIASSSEPSATARKDISIKARPVLRSHWAKAMI